jgi:hypothetical protein
VGMKQHSNVMLPELASLDTDMLMCVYGWSWTVVLMIFLLQKHENKVKTINAPAEEWYDYHNQLGDTTDKNIINNSLNLYTSLFQSHISTIISFFIFNVKCGFVRSCKNLLWKY